MTELSPGRVLSLLVSALLCLSLLLSGCAGPAVPAAPDPTPQPAPPTATPVPTPRPTMRVVVEDELDGSPADVYREAVMTMRRCEFEKAAALFEQLDDFSDSEINRDYCLKRLNAEPIPEKDRYLVPQNWLRDFPDGKLYAISLGYIYVPFTCDENTRCCVYFAGGAGEDYLYRRGVYHYLKYFQPNAVMLFHYESVLMHMGSGIPKAAEVLEQVAQECGIVLHDAITVGSSAGSYTALHAAVVLQRDFHIPVHAALCLDAGMEWVMPSAILLSDDDCRILAEHGTVLGLFEQEKARDYPEIHRMADLGVDVLVIACSNDDHNTISVHAYTYGLFSWGLEEIELDPEEYTAYPIRKETARADSAG
ncbi:MAG: hypothetical protein Q4E38_01970 [Eubacteriales bacterium]|nr:hypothetical protein [Eubacteriales bacterium]